MNWKRVWLVLFLFSVVIVGTAFAQRAENSGVSAIITTKPGVGNAKFYSAEVRNANPYNVSVEIVFTANREETTRGGNTRNGINVVPQSTRIIVPARQTKSVQIASGTDLRVRIVELNVKPLQ